MRGMDREASFGCVRGNGRRLRLDTICCESVKLKQSVGMTFMNVREQSSTLGWESHSQTLAQVCTYLMAEKATQSSGWNLRYSRCCPAATVAVPVGVCAKRRRAEGRGVGVRVGGISIHRDSCGAAMPCHQIKREPAHACSCPQAGKHRETQKARRAPNNNTRGTRGQAANAPNNIPRRVSAPPPSSRGEVSPRQRAAGSRVQQVSLSLYGGAKKVRGLISIHRAGR